MRACDVDGCDAKHFGRGYCQKHYLRLIKTGSTSRPSREDRFWAQIVVTGFCWNWSGRCDPDGYGHFTYVKSDKRINTTVHRYAYMLLVGPIPDGLTLDHLCRNRVCVNPDHLEPTDSVINVLRGFSPSSINSRKTHCDHGHEFTSESTHIQMRVDGRSYRRCRTCSAEQARKKRRAATA